MDFYCATVAAKLGQCWRRSSQSRRLRKRNKEFVTSLPCDKKSKECLEGNCQVDTLITFFATMTHPAVPFSIDYGMNVYVEFIC